MDSAAVREKIDAASDPHRIGVVRVCLSEPASPSNRTAAPSKIFLSARPGTASERFLPPGRSGTHARSLPSGEKEASVAIGAGESVLEAAIRYEIVERVWLRPLPEPGPRQDLQCLPSGVHPTASSVPHCQPEPRESRLPPARRRRPGFRRNCP